MRASRRAIRHPTHDANAAERAAAPQPVPHLRAVPPQHAKPTDPPPNPNDISAEPSNVALFTRPQPAQVPETASNAVHEELCPLPSQLPVAPPDDEAPIPRPRPEMLGRLALQAFEVLEGTRSLAQLGNLISFELSQHLAELRCARQEQQQVNRDHRFVLATVGSIRSCSISDSVIEATVILHSNRRVFAVAVRLEWAHNRWRASDLAVL